MSKFFINRPIVAIVISILMVLAGIVSMLGLPTAQFPNIADPQIQVVANYTGADAQTIEQSVATPIEQQMSGVDNSNYFYADRPELAERHLRQHLPGELRDDQPERRPDAGAGRGVGVDLRSGAVCDALLGESGQAGEPAHHGAGDHQRDPGAEQCESGGADRRGPGAAGAAVHLYSAGAGAASLGGGVRRDHRSRAAWRRDSAAEGCCPGGAGRAELLDDRAAERQAGGAGGRLPGPGRERGGHGRRRQEADGRGEEPFSTRPGLCGRTGHDAVGDRGHQGDRAHAGRGDRAGHPGGLSVPARVEGDADPAARGPGLAGRDVHDFSAAGLLDQHAVALRTGAGDRAGGRRRHRGGGGGGAPYRARHDAARRDRAGDGGGRRPGDRDRADSGGGVRADGVHSGNHGAALSAVRGDDRGVGGVLGLQRVDLEPGAFGDAAAPEEAGPGAAGGVLPRIQQGLRPGDRRVCEHLQTPDPQGRRLVPAAGAFCSGRGILREACARGLSAGRGPGLRLRRTATAGRVVVAAHGGRLQSRRGRSAQDAGREVCELGGRVQHVERREHDLQLLLLRLVQGLGGAQDAGGELSWDQAPSDGRPVAGDVGNRVRLSAAGDPGRGCVGRLHVRARGPLRRDDRVSGEEHAALPGGGAEAPGAGRGDDDFALRRAPGGDHRRPGEGADAAGEPGERLSDAADLHGRLAGELFQPLRPAMAGLCAGRGQLSNVGRQPGQVLCEQQLGPDGAVEHVDGKCAEERTGVRDEVQPVPVFADQRFVGPGV